MRNATYLINRISTRSLLGKTPYEMLREKKPNLTHLKVFRCIGYARNEAVGSKKLDGRSRVLVHLGTEPGSKAYRLLEPSLRKIVVSRDVTFDESQGWNWSNMEPEEDKSSETFLVEFGVSSGEGDTVQHVNTTRAMSDVEAPIDIEEHEEDDECEEPEIVELKRSTRTE